MERSVGAALMDSRLVRWRVVHLNRKREISDPHAVFSMRRLKLLAYAVDVQGGRVW